MNENGVSTKPSVRKIIEKWYGRLPFSRHYDAEFQNALDSVEISDTVSYESYDYSCDDGKRNLLSFLFFAEALEAKYAELGISEEILLDTLRDVVIYTDEWSTVKGELYLGQLKWLKKHFEARLFRLGRLQFYMSGAERDIPEYKLKKGDPVLEIHIPKGGRLDEISVWESINTAKKFFAEYFPDFKYKAITCHSWLLGEKLKAYLPEHSNIIRFGDMFDKLSADPSNILLRYLFRWDTNELNLAEATASTDFAEKIKKAVLGGEIFETTLGVLKEKN